MNKQVEKKIEQLREQIRRHNNNYYILTKPTISDLEFDNLLRELEELEKQNPHLITPDSPTQKVGSDIAEEAKLIKHQVPMLSIQNESDLYKFDQSIKKKLSTNDPIEYIVEPKIDGTSVNLNYINGVLHTAATRGDGIEGEDITDNVRTITNIPKEIKKDDSISYKLENIEVRGEIFIYIRDFETLNKEQESKGEKKLANPRNAAAGIIRMKNKNEVAKRPLNNFAYTLISIGEELNKQEENLEILRKLGFSVNEFAKKCIGIDQVIETCQELENIRKGLTYEIDGAVIKVNSIEQQKIIGVGTKYPHWARAYKFYAEKAKTSVNRIVWQVGRTGAVTPVAELEPVKLAGSTISRATLHNYDEIKRKDIRVRDEVIIEKGGDVIPKVVEVVKTKGKKRSSRTRPPEKCPSCGYDLFKSEDEVAYYCKNPECPAQLTNKVQHFVSRDALDIEAIAENVSNKLIELGIIDSPLDLFELKMETLTKLNLGTKEDPHIMGEKNATKAIQALKKAKTKPLSRWLFAIGIPKLGQIGAQQIANKHETLSEVSNSPILNNIIQLRELTEKANLINPRSHLNPVKSDEEKKSREIEFNILCDKINEIGVRLVKIGWYKQNKRKSKNNVRTIPEFVLKNNEGVGVEAAKSVLEFLNSDIGNEIIKKINALGIHPQKKEDDSNLLEGKIFVLTGTLSSLTRPQASELIIKNGGKVTSSVSKNISYLLAGDKPGSKFDEAKKYGIEILSEDKFLKLISRNPNIRRVLKKGDQLDFQI